MTDPSRRVLRGAKVILAVAGIVGYMFAAHRVSTAPPPAGFGTVLFAVAPLFAVVLAIGWRHHRVPAIALCVAGAALLWREADAIGRHLPFVYLLQGVSANAALMLVFAASLRAGHEPLISRLAAMVRGRPLAPEIVTYTRRVTLAWTLFFAAMILISTALFIAAPITAWSVFANLLSTPLVALMFVVEYIIRRRVLRDFPHSPISESVRAWWNSGHASERLTAPPR